MKTLSKVLLASFAISVVLACRNGPVASLIAFVSMVASFFLSIVIFSIFGALSVKNASPQTVEDYKKRVDSFKNK